MKFPGLFKLGTIESFSETDYTVQVSVVSNLNEAPQKFRCPIPVGFFGNKNVFIGGSPTLGTQVIIGQAEGGNWYIVSTLIKDISAKPIKFNSKLPQLNDCIYFYYGKNNIKADNNELILKSNDSYISLNVDNSCFNKYESENVFTEASYQYSGLIKRNTIPNVNFSHDLLNEQIYDQYLSDISLDPTLQPEKINIHGEIRNPPFVEQRSIVYEFANSYNILSDDEELYSYKTNQLTEKDNRSQNRFDVLNLNLNYPNQLIEKIEGTVVDIYGNILDLNRIPIPIGKDAELMLSKVKDNTADQINIVYRNIKEELRRSIAYHFEINARKNNITPPDVENFNDYAKDRSRFFLDIDKEGQFKLNVPSSSETGNVSIPTRYETHTSINKNSSQYYDTYNYNEDNYDIYHESFGQPIISVIKNETEHLPIDRKTEDHLKHGTVYHKINDVIYSTQNSSYGLAEYIETISLEVKPSIVSSIIYVNGPLANGGGRSGAINFDGSLEVNIGANTIDRHSLWLDCAGGIVSRVGRDKNNVSIASSMDGEVFIEVGGSTVNNDSRFTVSNSHIPGVVDIRVFNESFNEFTLFRINKFGIEIATPGRMILSANQGMLFRSAASIEFEAEDLLLQGRPVKRIGKTI